MALPSRFKIEPVWTGRTAVIVGGGPSLSLKQIHTIAKARLELESKVRVIAVNDAIYPCFWADWLHACDYGWWAQHIQMVNTFAGVRTTLAEDVPEPWVKGYLENSGDSGFDPDPSKCRSGSNSVYQAMHIAIHTGARKIVLVGVDMKNSPDGEIHWFGKHPGIMGDMQADYEKTMLPHFETLKPALEERGVEVVNANMASALKAFPFRHLDEAL